MTDSELQLLVTRFFTRLPCAFRLTLSAAQRMSVAMDTLRSGDSGAQGSALDFALAGEALTATASGGLWWAAERTLVVSDLHLEKGSSFAMRGQLLPPYDTAETLRRLETLLRRFAPARVIALGDSFHDRGAPRRLSDRDVAHIRAMTARTEWIWIEGNHDPAPPEGLGGASASALKVRGLTFRHEPAADQPSPGQAEIVGHFHPSARVRGRGGSVRCRCFVFDGQRMILPALGSFTGGLNVLAEPIQAVLQDGFELIAIGGRSVYRISPKRLIPDGAGEFHPRLRAVKGRAA